MATKNRGVIPGTWYPYKTDIKLEAREYMVDDGKGGTAKATTAQLKQASFVDTNGNLLLYAKKAVADYFGLTRAKIDDSPKTVKQKIIQDGKVVEIEVPRSKRRVRPKGKPFKLVLHKPYTFKDPDSGKSAANVKTVTLNVHPKMSVYEVEEMISTFKNLANIKGIITPSGTMRVLYGATK